MDTKEIGRKPVRSAPRQTQGARRTSASVAAPPRPRTTRPVKRPAPRSQRPPQEVVYTPPKPFDRNRLLLQLGIVGAVVLAVFISLWLFFKVGNVAVSNLGTVAADGITVTGSGHYSIETIVEASGIRKGDSLLGINKPRVSSRIITKLPYIKSVRIGIKLPGTVNIEVEELDVVYSIAEQDGTWWFVTSDGKLVEKTDAARASEFTKILGVHLDMPVAGQQAVAKELEAESKGDAAQPPQVVTISNAQRLETALAILRYLEEGNVMGEVVSVNVTNMGNIELWYGNQFRILLGDTMDMKYKIEMALAAIKQLADHDRGTLDVSFIVRDEVVYTPQSD